MAARMGTSLNHVAASWLQCHVLWDLSTVCCPHLLTEDRLRVAHAASHGVKAKMDERQIDFIVVETIDVTCLYSLSAQSRAISIHQA